jgi:hypothetical protein
LASTSATQLFTVWIHLLTFAGSGCALDPQLSNMWIYHRYLPIGQEDYAGTTFYFEKSGHFG